MNRRLVLKGFEFVFVGFCKIVFMMRYKFILLICILIFSLQKSLAQMYLKDIPKSKIPVPHTGDVYNAFEFKDAAGLHFYLVTQTDKEKNLFGTCYTQVNGNYIKDWEIKDYSSLAVDFMDYTKIVDIDKDGIYETIFVYRLPTENNHNYGGYTWKLMLHYKNKKYALRAHVPDLDGDEYDATLDKSFDTLPKSVKKYVIDYWNKIAEEQDFKGRYVLN